jgi:hypothetical protein
MVRIAQIERTNMNALGLLTTSAQAGEMSVGFGAIANPGAFSNATTLEALGAK